ncbi:MAG: hypothetical protein BWY83_02489 [bacterium ADurb.Bin478]|nr:MAG: hypothetical protein BWY83_02489 [bacterium ADurb.Bin478]
MFHWVCQLGASGDFSEQPAQNSRRILNGLMNLEYIILFITLHRANAASINAAAPMPITG